MQSVEDHNTELQKKLNDVTEELGQVRREKAHVEMMHDTMKENYETEVSQIYQHYLLTFCYNSSLVS